MSLPRAMVATGVQTWSTDVAAVGHFWCAADELGYARITYGDGLWDFTHDGWTMLGALAVLSRRARIGPALTCAFDPAAHHPSWLAKRAVAVDHLSGGRLDLRLGAGVPAATVGAEWERHGIRYPSGGARVAVLDEALAVMNALWRGETVEASGSALRLHRAPSRRRCCSGPGRRYGSPRWARGPLRSPPVVPTDGKRPT